MEKRSLSVSIKLLYSLTETVTKWYLSLWWFFLFTESLALKIHQWVSDWYESRCHDLFPPSTHTLSLFFRWIIFFLWLFSLRLFSLFPENNKLCLYLKIISSRWWKGLWMWCCIWFWWIEEEALLIFLISCHWLHRRCLKVRETKQCLTNKRHLLLLMFFLVILLLIFYVKTRLKNFTRV